MRVLVLGGSGMLGHKLVQRLTQDMDVFASVRAGDARLHDYGIAKASQLVTGIDARDESSVRRAIFDARPDVVINAIGIVKQLPTSKDVINILEVNSILPHKLRLLSGEIGFRLITISTDCVFLGDRGNYNEGDSADALDLYGRSKNIGEVLERNCLTIRTSIIGRELSTSHSLVEWFLSNRGGHVKGFGKAIYTGFPTIVFADIIRTLLLEYPDLDGLFHISSQPINKFELLSLVNNAYRCDTAIDRDDTVKIDRSLDSSRFRELTGFTPLSWEEMIERMAADPTPYEEWRNQTV